MDQNNKMHQRNKTTDSSSRASDNSESFATTNFEESQGRHFKDKNSRPEVIQQAIPIPFYKVGWVVGRQGSYIAQLCRKSGATITISDTESREFGTTWKYVMMYGTGREIDRAKKLLHIRLERYIAKTPQEMEAARCIITDTTNYDIVDSHEEHTDPATTAATVDRKPNLDDQQQGKAKDLRW